LGDYLPEELEAGPYKHLQGLDRDRRAALEEVQVEHFVERRGEEARQVRKVKFKLHDKQARQPHTGASSSCHYWLA
jgi:phage terminase small subunit